MNEFWGLIKEYCTPQTVTTITAVLMFLVACLKLVSMVKTLKKQNALTLQNVQTTLLASLKEQNKEELSRIIVEVTQPMVTAVQSITPYLETFSKILALSQENTPTSRLAILELLQQMGKTDVNLIEVAKETINEEVKIIEEKKQEVIDNLNKIENRPVE